MGVDSTIKLITSKGLVPQTEELMKFSNISSSDLKTLESEWVFWDDIVICSFISMLYQLFENKIGATFDSIFKCGLTHSSSVVRIYCLLAISNTPDKTLIKTICRILDSDLDQNVSGVAADVLSIFCEMALNDKLTKKDNSLIKSKLKALVKSCRFDNQNRLKALMAVSVFNDSEMDHYINYFYSSTDISEKQASISSMGRTANLKWLIYVRESLFNSSTRIRIEAIKAFPELCDVEMAEELTELIDDPELSVQLATIFALKKIGGRQSVTLLIKSLKSPEPEVVSASIDSLRFISHEDNFELNLFNDINEHAKKEIASENKDIVFEEDWSTLAIKSSEEQNELDPFIDVSEVNDFWDRNN